MSSQSEQQTYSLRSCLPAYIAAGLGAVAGAAIYFFFAAATHYYIYLLAVLSGFLCMLGYSKLHGPKGWPRLICMLLFTATSITLGFWLFHAFQLHVLKSTVFDGISFRVFILVHPVMDAGKTIGDVIKNWLITLVFACLGFAGKDVLPVRRQSDTQNATADEPYGD